MKFMNPSFSLNETFATRMAAAMAEGLGGVLTVSQRETACWGPRGVERFGLAGKGLRGAIRGLVGGQKTK
jgi:hypothetical protein